MELQQRELFIAKIAKEHPHIGKTAMMKCLYLLQTVEKVPLDYSFEIYTYGPYASSVMNEIDDAHQNGYIDMSGVSYPSGQFGYDIVCSDKGNAYLSGSTFIDGYSAQIDNIVNVFAQKSAKELELLSTVVYVVCLHDENNWETTKESICEAVKGIKPHFTYEEIAENYDFLSTNDYLKKALR
jgi:uncharacterized protein YwgA